MENRQLHGNQHIPSPATPGVWQPLLTGERQATALATVTTIAEALRARPVVAGYQPDLALFFAYLHLAVEHGQADGRYGAQAHHLLEGIIDHIATTPLGVGLYGGLAGVGWSLAHVGRLLDIDIEEPNAIIDEVLSEVVDQRPWPGEYDLIGGLVGIGVYALERLPNDLAAAMLVQVVDRLDELAVVLPAGITWFTPPERLPDPQRAVCPNGYYNLGVAHGVPGVVGLLGRAVAAGVAIDKAWRLLVGAVRWLLEQEIETGGAAGFPSWVAVAPEGASPPRVARSAWCYGDPGVAATLLSVAPLVDESAWQAAALRIARRAAERPLDQSGVQDGCLCHGAAGLAHLFNRLYQATGDPQCGECARFWFEQTLAIRRPEEGIAGYCFLRRKGVWEDTPGFLEGAAGIGLALLAAATPLAPLWDRLLLLDLP
jgi:hypothetical protein